MFMDEMKYFLDNPYVDKFIDEKIHILLDESDRGILVVGMSLIDIELEETLKIIAPTNMTQNEKKWINNASFASKLNILYISRWFPRNLFSAVNKLNKIRNKVAHNSKKVDLNEYDSELKDIFELLGNGVSVFIHNKSTKILADITINELSKIKDPSNQKNFFADHKSVLEYLSKYDNNIDNKLEKPIQKMKFSIGILLINALIISYREESLKILEKNKIISLVPIRPRW